MILKDRHNKPTCIWLLVQLFFWCISVVLWVVGASISNFSPQMLGAFCAWLASMTYCVGNIKKRIILCSFNVVIFVFLMCRPLIDIAKGKTRWGNYAQESVSFAICSVALSILFLQLGAMLYEYLVSRKKNKQLNQNLCFSPKNCDPVIFRKISFLLYLFCMLFFLIQQIDALVFIQGRTYTDYYLYYSPSYPSYVYTIAEMMPYALCIYLATFPRKRPAFFALSLYVISAIPKLIIGVRNPIILNLIFAFLYYCIRDIVNDPQKWIGKVEKLCIICCAPLAAFALSLLNYLRAGIRPQKMGFISAIIDLFYKQGVSFDVLCMGYHAIPDLPGENKCYTFGGIIDRFMRGRIGQMLFNTTPLPASNSKILAVEGNSFAHSMSYVAHPRYLEGEGWGSSYLLETFADFGWVGLLLFSFLLGVLLIWIIDQMKGHWLVKSSVLIALTDLLFVPRASATGWLEFLTTIHFWFIIIACLVLSKISQRINLFQYIDTKLNMIKQKNKR